MLNALEGIQVGLEVVLHSFATWVDRNGNQYPNSTTGSIMTPRTPGRKAQDKCGFYLWLRLDQIKELCSVWKHALQSLAGDAQKAVVDEEYSRILRSISTLLAVAGEFL